MQGFIDFVFWVDVTILTALLIGAVWSVAYPAKRLWPPPASGSWQHRLAWVFFYTVFGLNAVLIIFDWNSWIFETNLRFVIGVPIALIGALLVAWGVFTLGAQNTSGVKDRFVISGPYAFTRNPQYLGDIILFVGLSLIANSLYLWITHTLTIIVFAVAPLAEELWLEEQYGDDYVQYKHGTSRFL
jgi:protein-S-isoprenylcysteine O-methyltransferase Ste14